MSCMADISKARKPQSMGIQTQATVGTRSSLAIRSGTCSTALRESKTTSLNS